MIWWQERFFTIAVVYDDTWQVTQSPPNFTMTKSIFYELFFGTANLKGECVMEYALLCKSMHFTATDVLDCNEVKHSNKKILDAVNEDINALLKLGILKKYGKYKNKQCYKWNNRNTFAKEIDKAFHIALKDYADNFVASERIGKRGK